jgi:hypothetical protein
VGSVAEETARFVEALGGWAEGLRPPAPAAAPNDTDGTDAANTHGQPTDRSDGGGDPPRSAEGTDEAGTRHTVRCEHCGVASRAGEALACQLCPLCQGIALLRTVRPETVERLADLAASLSGALRDIAADRFREPPPAPPPRGQRVQDISVDDEDEPGPAPTDRPRRTQESTAP